MIRDFQEKKRKEKKNDNLTNDNSPHNSHHAPPQHEKMPLRGEQKNQKTD